MRKKLFIVSMVVLLVTSVFLFSASKKDEMWRKAITEKDTNLRFQYLKEFEAEFGDKDDKISKYLYLNLCDAAFKLANYDETITFGEKALTFDETDHLNKLRIYFMLANSFKVTQKDLDKAYDYAQKTIDLANELISKRENLQQTQENKESHEQFINSHKTFYLAPAYRIQSQILYAKNTTESLKEATKKAVEAFKTDQSGRSSDLVFTLAFKLYEKKFTDDAIASLEAILDKEKPEHRECNLLANCYIRKNDKDKAADYFELAYQSNKQANLAKKIGQLVHKKNIDKGIKYFAEAFVLSNSNKQSDAYRYLENLYFNKPDVKSKTPAEQEKGFKEIINAARVRLGKEPINTPPAGTEVTEKTSDSQTAEG
jgi:hypothetical protein